MKKCINLPYVPLLINEKEFTIGKHQGRSREWLLEEIKKCVCLCSNCHRKIHAGIINLEDYLK